MAERLLHGTQVVAAEGLSGMVVPISGLFTFPVPSPNTTAKYFVRMTLLPKLQAEWRATLALEDTAPACSGGGASPAAQASDKR